MTLADIIARMERLNDYEKGFANQESKSQFYVVQDIISELKALEAADSGLSWKMEKVVTLIESAQIAFNSINEKKWAIGFKSLNDAISIIDKALAPTEPKA